MYNAYFIQHSLYLNHPPPFVLSHCPSYYYSVAFQCRCAQVLQIYGNKKLTDPHFQEKIWSISVHPSEYIQPQNAHTNFHACRQKHPARRYAFVWDEDIAFSGILSEVRSIVEITKGVQAKILDHKFLKLWTYQSPPPPPPLSLSLSLQTGADTQALFTQCLPVECIVFSFFYLFRYSLIPIHLVKKNSTRTAVGVILTTLWWNAPMFYHPWCQTNAALMRTSTNNPLFSSSCTTWLINVHPTWSDENILAVLHIIPLDLQFHHVQRHVR